MFYRVSCVPRRAQGSGLWWRADGFKGWFKLVSPDCWHLGMGVSLYGRGKCFRASVTFRSIRNYSEAFSRYAVIPELGWNTPRHQWCGTSYRFGWRGKDWADVDM